MSENKAKRVISETPTKFGYVVRNEIWCLGPEGPDGWSETEITTCYTDDGNWIGDENTTKFPCEEKGIKPTHKTPMEKGILRPCQIGFCEDEQKWYGWSHRAIFGFGVGDEVKEGDLTNTSGWTDEHLQNHPEDDCSLPVGFKAEALDDARDMAIAFAESVS